MEINYLKFSTIKSLNGKVKGFEINGLDVWESFTKKDALKIAWFLISKVIFK